MEWIRNRGKLLFLAVVFTVMLSQTVLAEQSGKITAESVKIRSSADASSTVVGSTERGKTVTITGKTTDASGTVWYQVYVDENVTGYIRGDLLELSGTGSVPEVQTSSANAGDSGETGSSNAQVTAASGTGTVTPPSTNIRNSAVTGDVICTLQSGAVVTIIGETTGSDSKKWYQVSFIKDSKEYTGYIRGDLVDTTNAGASTSAGAEVSGAKEPQGEETEQPAAEEPQGGTVNPDASLKSLTLSSGTITPAFSSDITSYTIQTEETVTAIAISAVVTNPDAQIVSAEGFDVLNPGMNTAAIVVQAPDGTTQSYDFSIICGDAAAVSEGEEQPQEDSIEIEGAMEDNFEEDGSQNTIDIEEYNKYKELAEKRLIVMCVLGFLVALAFVVILNLLLKIHDLKEEAGMDEEDEEEEKPVRRNTSKKPLFEKHEYVKLDEKEEKPLKQTLTEKEQIKRADQRAQKSVLMPDLRKEKKAQESYESDTAYEDEGLDDDFEFEFINLDKR